MPACDIGSQVVTECKTSRRSLTSLEDVSKAVGKIDTQLLYDIPLIPVNCRFSLIQEQPQETMALQPLIQKERRAGGCKVTVLFAIRRPGCGNCREHGRQLTEINRLERDVAFLGAMKHGSGVDDTALLDFYQQYYRFPLYKDEDWKIYKAMGGRKVSFFKALSLVPRLEARYKKKGITNIPFGGDIWTQGGVMIFDREGNLRRVFYETFGEELDIPEIRQAIQEARKPYRNLNGSSSSSVAFLMDNSFSASSMDDWESHKITAAADAPTRALAQTDMENSTRTRSTRSRSGRLNAKLTSVTEQEDKLPAEHSTRTRSTRTRSGSGKTNANDNQQKQRAHSVRASKIREGLARHQEDTVNKRRVSATMAN